MTPNARLRRRIAAAPDRGPLIAPGVYDAMGAAAAEAAGFEAAYLSGASIAYSRLGGPDLGLIALPELVETVALIRERTDLPLVVDADNGFGNALNVRRTLRRLERAGASAVQLEDQSFPKRCGHLADKSLIEPAEMVGKIRAAVDSRQDPDLTLIIRTDAVAVEGFDAAMARAEAYLEAGADVLFVEAPQDEAQLAAVPRRFAGRVPTLANMVEGGRTPNRTAQALGELGFSIVIFPGGLARAVVQTMQAYFASLRQHGSNAPFRERMLDFQGINDFVRTPEVLAWAARFEGQPDAGEAHAPESDAGAEPAAREAAHGGRR